MTLRTRVIAAAALIAVVLIVALVAITRTTEAKLLGQVDTQLQGAAGPAVGLQRPPAGTLPPNSGRPLTSLSSLYVGIVRNGGIETLVEPNLSGKATPLPAVTASEAMHAATSRKPFTVHSVTGSSRYRVRAYADARDGTVAVVAVSIDSVYNAVARLIAVELVGAGLILAVLALVTWWVIHLGVRPVKTMTTLATGIAEGELSARVQAADPRTEAGELGDALNKMLARIETAFQVRAEAEDQLRQFVADASHELRTPVSTIRGYAELYRAGGLEDREQLDDAIRRTEQEAIRMGALVDDLLLLARIDQGRPLESDPVDLTKLAADAVSDARAVDPGRRIEAVNGGPLVVMGDEQRLRQVIANVVGNALVHTPAGTRIEFRTRAEDGAAVIEICDDGPGMAREVATHAFERFYRADPARSRHRGGSGLGLAIVDATVKAHGGSTGLRSSPGEGTVVRIELPRVMA
jgi:two-component system OmpR family sensor kinase